MAKRVETVVTFAMQPTSVLICKGPRIRIAIAGSDRGASARVPETGTPQLRIAWGPADVSFVDLPARAK